MACFAEVMFRGVKSMSLESEDMRIIVLLEFGAKVASVVNKRTGYEFLWQEPGIHRRPEYDMCYVEGDLSGMDDMFPTINECFYPSGHWQGTRIPDHGELWSIPWDCQTEDGKLHMWTYGVRLPYRFDKWMHFTNAKTLRIDYKATNLSSFNMDFLWAAHPLFNIEQGAKIVFPEDVSKIINTLNLNNRLGKVGSVHNRPLTTDKDGCYYDLSSIPPRDSGLCEKFFALERMTEGWVKLLLPEAGEKIKLSFPVGKVPYVGIWINAGGLKGQYNMALEPATGALDDIYVSKMWEDCSRLEPKKSYEFFLEISI